MKMKYVVSSLVLITSIAQASEWLNEYKVDSLPNQQNNWIYQGNYLYGGMAENGILEIDTSGSNARSHVYAIENTFSPNDDFIIEARAKHTEFVGSPGCGIWMANGVKEEVLLFTSTGVRLLNSGLTYANPTTFNPKEFHTYKVVKQGSNIDVYMDGNLIISGANIYNTASSRNWVAFGDGASIGSCKGYWDFIRYSVN